MIMAVTKPGDHSSQVQKSYKMACQALEMRRVQELRGSESGLESPFCCSSRLRFVSRSVVLGFKTATCSGTKPDNFVLVGSRTSW